MLALVELEILQVHLQAKEVTAELLALLLLVMLREVVAVALAA
jgi:hypothetical protein